MQHGLNLVNSWERVGVRSLKICQLGQGWWYTQDLINRVIKKQGGSGGKKVEKKCVMKYNENDNHTVENTYQ